MTPQLPGPSLPPYALLTRSLARIYFVPARFSTRIYPVPDRFFSHNYSGLAGTFFHL